MMSKEALELFALCSYDSFGLADISIYMMERDDRG